MNKNMSNKANLGQSQIFITSMKAKSYNEKMKLDTWSKQTQSNPILNRISMGSNQESSLRYEMTQ
jgi:hypothetical protein